MFNIGDKLTKENYTAGAIWCNENNAIINAETWIIEEHPKPSIEELKTIKRNEVNRARDKKEQGGFEYLGKIFDSDLISCQRISCAAQAFAQADDSATIVWTCQDNSTIELNKAQLLGLVVALAQHSNTCHEEATAIKQKIDAAQTIEELEAIFE